MNVRGNGDHGDHPAHGAATAGFTLLELTVVMGLLAVFCMFLVQVLLGGVQLYDEGESSQALADRTQAATSAASEALQAMVGPSGQPEPGTPPTARLVVQWVPLGFSADPGARRVQVVRATVQIAPADEERLLRKALLPEAQAAARAASGPLVEQQLDQLLAATPRAGRAGMVLLPWPSGDPEGVYLDLRRALFLPGQRIPIDDRGARGEQADPMQVRELGTPELPAPALEPWLETIATGLMHFEVAMWAQTTRSWSEPPGHGGPELAWDSARAGWLLPEEGAQGRAGTVPPGETFALDIGPESLLDPTDDVFPHWLRLTLVAGPGIAADAVLTAPLAPDGKDAMLSAVDRLPVELETQNLLIGSEWVRWGGVQGTRLTALLRGRRGTKAVRHEPGTRVRAGRESVLDVAVLHGRDAWNG